MAFRVLISSVIGYVLGTIPSASIASRLAGGDRRVDEQGSGNPGGANAINVLGKKWGVGVTLADIIKAFIAARVGNRLAGSVGANVAATAAVAGHSYPLGRRGGKGVAASIGQVAGTMPAYIPLDAALAGIGTRIPVAHRARAGTALASLGWISIATLWWRRGWPNPGGPEVSWALPAGAIVSSAIIAERFESEAHRVTEFRQGDNEVGDGESEPTS